jgi:hypothetical protein
MLTQRAAGFPLRSPPREPGYHYQSSKAYENKRDHQKSQRIREAISDY